MENYPRISKPWSCPDRALYLLQLFSSHTATGHILRISLKALYRLAKQPQSWKFQSVKWQFDATVEQLKKQVIIMSFSLKQEWQKNQRSIKTWYGNAHSFGSLQEWNKSVEREKYQHASAIVSIALKDLALNSSDGSVSKYRMDESQCTTHRRRAINERKREKTCANRTPINQHTFWMSMMSTEW